jgi:hypothetical protein
MSKNKNTKFLLKCVVNFLKLTSYQFLLICGIFLSLSHFLVCPTVVIINHKSLPSVWWQANVGNRPRVYVK